MTSAAGLGIAGRVDAIIVDVDGTLYRQGPVRRAIAWRLMRTYCASPREGATTLRILRAYRRAQETLRRTPGGENDLTTTQRALAARWTRTAESIVETSVTRWMEQEPLDLLREARRDGVIEFLEAVSHDGVRLGVFSDYPAIGKLIALDVLKFFGAVVSAQDPDVGRFKPDPLGIEVAIRRLGAASARTLYIGDRPDTDACAAYRAGVACVILGRLGRTPGHHAIGLRGFRELRQLLLLN